MKKGQQRSSWIYSADPDKNSMDDPGNCRWLRRTKDGRRIPCRSQRCPNRLCRVKYAQREAAILKRSFREKEPNFNLTLSITDDEPIVDTELSWYLKNLTGRFRYLRKRTSEAFEYYMNIEFTNGKPHVHLTVITTIGWSVYQTKMCIKEMWEKSIMDRKGNAVYCDEVANHIGLANYLPKNIKDRDQVETPPTEWSGKACKFVWNSKGFLTRSRAVLWREQCAEWYPCNQSKDTRHGHQPPLKNESRKSQGKPKLSLWRKWLETTIDCRKEKVVMYSGCRRQRQPGTTKNTIPMRIFRFIVLQMTRGP